MENSKKYFIIDFDSTFTQVEALDVLGEICLSDSPNKKEVLDQIAELTDLGMDGKISFRESLEKRVSLLKANHAHLVELVDNLKGKVSTSFERNTDFFKDFSENIYIVSNGFKEFIVPIVTQYGVKPENVYANDLIFDEEGYITGFNKENILSQDNGKVNLLKEMALNGDIYVIGDGYNDYEIKAAGLANKFYAFTENVERTHVTEKADHIAPSLDEILFSHKIKASISYPKNRIKILLLENVHPVAVQKLKEEGYNVEFHKDAMDEKELSEKIRNVSVLGIRSKTKVTRKVLENANRLMAVGAFCIGTNQIDLEECTKRGIAVFNAPFSNTRSVVELAIGEIILLLRNLPDKMMGMHQGKWRKSASGSFEVRGKKLGIVGYGNIGSQLSILAESMGMEVYYYDIIDKLALSNARVCRSMEELLSISDIVSLHVDGRPENRNMIGKDEFDMMKDGVVFVNLARGHVVDIAALKEAIDSGKVRGAAVDVFPKEPKSNDEAFVSELVGMPNTILTPHVGGSTKEAQVNIGEYVPGKIIDYINTGTTSNNVNFPEIQLPPFEKAHRLIHIHHNVPGVLAAINNVIAQHNLNIIGQFLKTNEQIGYMILAVDKEYDSTVIKDLKNIEHTIRFRVLY